jgi:hypothetical protein
MSLKTASKQLASTKTFAGSLTGGGGGGVTITSINITDNSWNNLDDTAIGTTGGYIKINGTGFVTNPKVFVNSTEITSGNITFISSSLLRVVVPSLSLGTYNIFVFNTDNSGAILTPGLVVSGTPDFTQTVYTTSTPLSVSVQLLATGDVPLTYELQAGSSLPAGCSLSSSGLITGTTVDGVYQFTVIVSDAQLQSFQQQITLTITSTDANFKSTVLAINADANTFVSDASTNNFPITINGDTRPSAFNPYNINWSGYFDGSDYLEITQNASLAFQGGGAWTWECFANITTGGTMYASYTGPSNSGGSFFVGTDSTNRAFSFTWILNGTDTWSFDSGTWGSDSNVLTLGAWQHLAISYNGSGTLRYFVNGVLVTTRSVTVNVDTLVYNVRIGRSMHPDYPSQFAGYISNMRFVKGTALYTATFTPPTEKLTPVANTVFLALTSNRLLYDESTVNNTIANSGVQLTSFGPFTETDTTNGSGYFDGTGDYLTLPSGTAFQFGTGNFTVEAWVYMTQAPTSTNSAYFIDARNSSQTTTWAFLTNGDGSANTTRVDWFTGSVVFTGANLILNSWNHCVYSRSGTTYGLFLNGTRVATGTDSTNYSISPTISYIGSRYSLQNYFQGYLTIRVVNGTAVYNPSQTTLTIPASPLTAIANTSLSTLQNRQPVNNHTFVDRSGINNLITKAGNSSQGSFSPFSPAGWSNYFDGTGDYFTVADNAALTMGASNFTIEGWFYPLNYTGSDKVIMVHRPVTTARGFVLGFSQTTGTPFLLAGDADNASWNLTLTGSTAATLNAWNHVAYTRNSSTWNIWLNGVSVASGTASFTADDSSTVYLFAGGDGGAAFPGYISNFRMVKGTALYTTTFTPPTAALTAIANTSLLTCQSNRFKDNSTNNFTLTVNGDARVVNFSPLAPTASYSPAIHGGSVYFDGTGDYLSVASNSAFTLGSSGDFTIECWVYLTASPSNYAPLLTTWTNSTNSYANRWAITYYSNRLAWFTDAGNIGVTDSVAPTLNEWTHIAAVRSGSTITLYKNGVSLGTQTTAQAYTTDGAVSIGFITGVTAITGYITSARIVKGTAVYTSNFTPPTAPVTAIANTSLLLNYNNAGIVDVTSRNVLETINVQIDHVNKKFGNGSFYTGTSGSNYIRLPASEFYQFGTKNFTVEGWFKPIGAGNERTFYMHGVNTAGGIALFVGTGGVRFRASTQTDLVYATTISNSTFTHIAFVRDGNIRRIFIDGQQVASDTLSFNVSDNVVTDIGASVQNASDSFRYYGYIDDLRITAGVARYTANFTPPTSTFLTQ